MNEQHQDPRYEESIQAYQRIKKAYDTLMDKYAIGQNNSPSIDEFVAMNSILEREAPRILMLEHRAEIRSMTRYIITRARIMGAEIGKNISYVDVDLLFPEELHSLSELRRTR